MATWRILCGLLLDQSAKSASGKWRHNGCPAFLSRTLIKRSVKNESGKKFNLSFGLDAQEAEGTKKLATLSPHLFHTLDHGGLLLIDDFDARLHPNLTTKLIEIFHSPNTNPHNAQLVFVSHDSNLLDARLLRRNQIAFTKKDKTGATEIYSLAEFKGVRNDSSFEKDYLMGKYGAVPTNLIAIENSIINYMSIDKLAVII